MSAVDVHTIMESLRQTSMAMFDFDEPGTNPPLIDWSGDVDDGLQLIEDLVALVRLLGNQVEITAPRGTAMGEVRGVDTHDSVALTTKEYDLLREVQRGR